MALRSTAKNRHRTALLACLVGLLSPGVSGVGAAQNQKKAAPPAKPRKAPARAAQRTLAQQARFRPASPDMHRRFYRELAGQGFQPVQYAAVPTRYALQDGAVRPVDYRFGTLFGDVDGDKKPEWVVACYFPSQKREETEPGDAMAGMVPRADGTYSPPEDDRARIVVFKQDSAGQWKFHWRSPGLGYEFRAPEYNVREVEAGLDRAENLRLPISLVDVDGDGTLEIAYHAWSESPMTGSMPGVFRFDGSKLVSVAPQSDRFSLADMNGDRRLELVTGSRYVGHGDGESDVPRVWRWNGRRYQEASREFPTYYAELVTRYRSHVRSLAQSGRPYERAAWERAIDKAVRLAGGQQASAGGI